MGFLAKVDNKYKIHAMPEKLETDLKKITQEIVKFNPTLDYINKIDEEGLEEIKKVLKNDINYQKAALKLFDFLRITTQWHTARHEL